jgi:hypothetical protein
MTPASEAMSSTETTAPSRPAVPDAPTLRMVGSSGSVCVDGVCSIEPVAASGQAEAEPS